MAKQMTMTSDFAPAHGRRHGMSTLLVWLTETRNKLANSLEWYSLYRDSAKELERLTNRELDDIGISRYDIPRVAAQSATAKLEQR